MGTTSHEVPDVARGQEEGQLKRVLGPKLLLLFIVGDILGAGVYAVTGPMAGMVGGILWLPFLLAFVVATMTALSYLELVTHYPHAAGAALYTHKAFGIHFLTFLVAFAVMSSGITSASTAARAFSANAAAVFDLELGEGIGITLIGLGFMTLVALVNLRGVGESVKANVVLTCVELSGLLIIIGIGVWALGDLGAMFKAGKPPLGELFDEDMLGDDLEGDRAELILLSDRLYAAGQTGERVSTVTARSALRFTTTTSAASMTASIAWSSRVRPRNSMPALSTPPRRAACPPARITAAKLASPGSITTSSLPNAI